jgi:hypothetical protein
VLDHGLETRQALAPAGRQRDLRHLASGAQALINPFEDGVVPDGDQRPPGQDGPDMGATVPGRAGPPQGATIPLAGRDTDGSATQVMLPHARDCRGR